MPKGKVDGVEIEVLRPLPSDRQSAYHPVPGRRSGALTALRVVSRH